MYNKYSNLPEKPAVLFSGLSQLCWLTEVVIAIPEVNITKIYDFPLPNVIK